jgi:hypothetical protein
MILGLTALAAAITLAQPGPAAAPPPPPHTPLKTAPAAAAIDWSPRLTKLTPNEPVAYFELAEEVAAEDRTMSGRTLARHLYVLAAHLPAAAAPSAAVAQGGAASSGPDWLPASACLGLAAIADTEQDRRWLIAMAGTLSPEGAGSSQGRPIDGGGTHDATALQLATALGYVRAGDGRKAMKILNTPAVSALLARYEGLLNPGGLAGGADRVRSLAERHVPCPQCRNRRTIRDADGVKLCPSCRGRPGPNLTVPELIGQLRLESLLLNGIQRSWAAQTVADGGAPMRELDVSVLLDVYDVDVRRSVWRDGQWIDPVGPVEPGTPAPAEPAPLVQPPDR